ncbi:hypothetical protein [Methylomonas lenta]|nr:hypothetical protein [Methylomonas lenta]
MLTIYGWLPWFRPKLLETEAAQNNMVEMINSPDMNPKIPDVKKIPVTISLNLLFEGFIVAS